MVSTHSGPPAHTAARDATWLAIAFALAVVWLAATAAVPAYAGQASSGELLFYPCDSCHPVTVSEDGVSSRKLPNDFAGHRIVLEGHDALGKGDTACLACHDDPASDPGMLKLADGTLVEITGDIAKVCYRCHADKYEEWLTGAHGKRQPACTASGCHDPHTPGSIYAEPLLPFAGNGFQFTVLPERAAFRALAPPAPDPHVETPPWFAGIAGLGLVVAAGIAGSLVAGKVKR